MFFTQKPKLVDSYFKIYSVKNFYIIKNQSKRKKISENIMANMFIHLPDCKGYSFPIETDPHPIFNKIYKKFLSTCEKHFSSVTLSDKNNTTTWCYLSNINSLPTEYHDHIKSSTINGVYYFEVNKNDSLSFKDDNREFRYNVEENELLIFPNYVQHKPIRTTGSNARVSLNMEIITLEDVNDIFTDI
jgi:hypothetical protein|tara:strand:- start:131 stop:694 length:564 start_codon:yes stop_codon:yes gene_type:complete